jgi:hypothetical protein
MKKTCFLAVIVSMISVQAISFDKIIDLSSGSQDFIAYGEATYDFFGSAVASGDVNGDGISDLVIGAPYDNSGGRVYVVFGKKKLGGSIDLSMEEPDILVQGTPGYETGFSVGSADINGDGYDDIFIDSPDGAGAGKNRVGTGEWAIVLGRKSFAPVIDLGNGEQDIIIYGAGNDVVGVNCFHGDLNKDGIEDLILTGDGDGPMHNRTGAGEAHVLFGKPSWPPAIDLEKEKADITVYGEDRYFQLGNSAQVLDINLDSVPDLFLGSVLASHTDSSGKKIAGTGKGYIFFGRQPWPSAIDLAYEKADIELYGKSTWSELGMGSAVGDLNGDGNKDLIVASARADGPNDSREDCGEVYVFYSSSSFPSEIDLAVDAPDLVVYGKNSHDYIGHEGGIASNDLNGDGIDDLIITTYQSNSWSGEVYCIFGNASRNGIIDLAQQDPDITILPADQGDQLGRTIDTGDFNGDKGIDILLGAFGASGPAEDKPGCGEAYLLYGEPKVTGCMTFDDLRAKIDPAVANQGLKKSMMGKVQHAEDKFNSGDLKESGNILCALVHETKAQSGKKIPTDSANQIIACIGELAAYLGIPIKCLNDEDSDEISDEASDESSGSMDSLYIEPKLFCTKVSQEEIELSWVPEDYPAIIAGSPEKNAGTCDLYEVDRSPYDYRSSKKDEIIYITVW